MEDFYSHFKWAGIITEAQWVTPVSLQTQDFPCPVATENQEDNYKTGEVRWGPAGPQSRRNFAFTNKAAANMWTLFPRPLISSDYAVVAGLRLEVSQGKMPSLLLGWLPWRDKTFLKITEELQYYKETFGDRFQTLSKVNTFNQD